MDQCILLLLAETAVCLLLVELYRGIHTGAVDDLHLLDRIDLRGLNEPLPLIQYTGICPLDNRIQNIVFGGKIVIDASFADTGFFCNIADGNVLRGVICQKLLHGIHDQFSFSNLIFCFCFFNSATHMMPQSIKNSIALK